MHSRALTGYPINGGMRTWHHEVPAQAERVGLAAHATPRREKKNIQPMSPATNRGSPMVSLAAAPTLVSGVRVSGDRGPGTVAWSKRVKRQVVVMLHGRKKKTFLRQRAPPW